MRHVTQYAALLALLIFSAYPLAMAQDLPNITIPKAQYIENQLKMMEQIEGVQSDMRDSTDKMMREKLTPEAYAEYQQNQKQAEQEQEKQIATCLGVPVQKVSELSDKVGAEFQIKVIKTCSAKLPEVINLSDADWTRNPEFSDYKLCAENLVAQETGISTEKLQACSNITG